MRVYYFHLWIDATVPPNVMILNVYPKDKFDKGEDGGVDDEPYFEDGTLEVLVFLGFDCEAEGEFACYTDKSVNEMKQILIESGRFEFNQYYWDECEMPIH